MSFFEDVNGVRVGASNFGTAKSWEGPCRQSNKQKIAGIL
jgi:hypothetical protein